LVYDNKVVNKSSFLNNKTNIAIICILGMFAGFLISRAFLSFFTFAFGVNALYNIHPKNWLRQKWWLAGAAWVAIYALTWFWSDDKANWGTRIEVKMPFLLLPLAFAFLPRFSARQLQVLTISLGCLLMVSACYSVSFFIRDPAYYIHEYRQSHILPTLPKDDHIRTSTAIALFIAWSMYAWPFITGKAARWFIAISDILLAIFLHLLAAKSGLLSFYLFVAAWGVYLAVAKKKVVGFAIIVAIPLLYFGAIRFIPTFRERAHYIDFTMYMLKSGDKTGIGDINRLMSYKTAVDLIEQHPLTGVGTGDMMTEMTKEYNRLYPEVSKENILLPHNQFLIVALGCGIPAMILFIVWVFMPLTLLRRNRESFFLLIIWIILLLQLMIEPVFEVQFGVFIYLVFLLMQRHEVVSTPPRGNIGRETAAV
jgi:O-antigen ligase